MRGPSGGGFPKDSGQIPSSPALLPREKDLLAIVKANERVCKPARAWFMASSFLRITIAPCSLRQPRKSAVLRCATPPSG